MKLFDLSGQVAIVTGGTKGIGRGIVERLAEHGARVVVSARDQAGCEAAAAEINQRYGQGAVVAAGIAANLDKVDTLQALVDKASATFGRIDILVCNAAILPFIGPSADTPRELFSRIMEGNIHNTFRLCHMVLPQMRARKSGNIVIIGSVSGLRPSTTEMAYGLSKAAQAHLARSLAAEVVGDRVRVNCIAPGLVRSFSSRPVWENDAVLGGFTRNIPLGRIGEPDDIAGGVVFLCSQAGSYITGQVIPMEGGVSTVPVAGEGIGDLEALYPTEHRFN
ncbi:MAG: SDR family NAD(P)-dependent oxidoreductase [Gammaproteobacteria bacterium]